MRPLAAHDASLRTARRLHVAPRLAEALDGGVQTAFDRSDRHRHDLGCVTVFHPPEVNQVHRVAKRLGQGLHFAADPSPFFAALDGEHGVAPFARHQVDQCSYGLTAGLVRLIQA